MQISGTCYNTQQFNWKIQSHMNLLQSKKPTETFYTTRSKVLQTYKTFNYTVM
jgi:hypothetical protein